jgi:ABC-type xylose transport system permease subunit
VLSMQLPFAIFPLITVTSDAKRMGKFVNPTWAKWLGYGIGAVISGLNIYLLNSLIGTGWVILAIAIVAGFAVYVRFFYREKRLLAG